MRVVGRQPLRVVLRVSGREPGEPSTHATAGRAVHPDAVLWKPEDDGVAGEQGPCSEPQARLAAHESYGHRSGLPETEAEPTGGRTPDLPVPVTRHDGAAGQPGVEHGYHVHSDGAGFRVPGSGNGLVQPVRTELGTVADHGGGVLRGSAEARLAARTAGDLQQRPGAAVHQREIHRGVGKAAYRDQYGRARALPGQHFRRTVVALTEIRGSVPEGLPIGSGGGQEHRAVLPFLQPRALAPEPRLPNAGSDLPGAIMNPGGRTQQPFNVFFPSLSRDILWKAGAVSRVRFAAQKPRALDTVPAFQQNPLRRKRREGVANRNHRWPNPAAQTQTPPGLAYCQRKVVLTMGSTLA